MSNDEERSLLPSSSSSSWPAACLNPTQRVVLWEVNLSRRCLNNFSKVINAHAIVMSLLVTISFVGFLQPPKGWLLDSDSNSYMFSSPSVVAFTVFNSLCLYSAVAGLLFYIFCSFSTIFTLASVPTPVRLDDRGMALVLKLRSALRLVALPSVQRRATSLFCFLATSLACCVGAYISAGLAAVGPSRSLVLAVAIPAVVGCIVIMYLLLLSAGKMAMELQFDERLRLFWTVVGAKEYDIEALDERAITAIDPVPEILRIIMKVICPQSSRIHGKRWADMSQV